MNAFTPLMLALLCLGGTSNGHNSSKSERHKKQYGKQTSINNIEVGQKLNNDFRNRKADERVKARHGVSVKPDLDTFLKTGRHFSNKTLPNIKSSEHLEATIDIHTSNTTPKRNDSTRTTPNIPETRLAITRQARKPFWNLTRPSNIHSSDYQHFRADDTKCRLFISDKKDYTTQLLKHNYNFVYLKLEFNNLMVKETNKVIDKSSWIWTYKGRDGAYQYLYLPNDFGYLSFGLLWAHSSSDYVKLKIDHTGNCSKLEVGSHRTDQKIGYALGNLTIDLASRKDRYNSSYWCYTQRVWLYSHALYMACQNTVCTFQTFEYVCCKYVIDFYTKQRDVHCSKSHYHFSRIWWMLPVIVGEAFFAFYPLFLASIGYRVRKFSRRILSYQRSSNARWQLNFVRNLTAVQQRPNENEVEVPIPKTHPKNDGYLKLTQTSPITFISTVCSPVFHINFNGKVVSRLLRLLIIFLPMILSAVRVCLDYRYAKVLVQKAVAKGGLVGFTSIIAGYKASRYNFLYGIGGPYVAIGIYVVFGSIFILVPESLETFLEKGLFTSRRHNHFILTMSLSDKERLGRVLVRGMSGYKRIYRYLLVHIYMLLHWRFWKQAFKLFVVRVTKSGFPWLRRRLCFTGLAVIFCIIVSPVYITFCVIELVCSTLYFAFPVISCFFILLKAYIVPFWEFFRERSILAKVLRNILFIPFFVVLCITWYMYCIIFFDGFWFISKIAMFTYSGIIAYPQLSYGYIILSFMALYYLVESFNQFGENYRELLKMSIDVCMKIEHNRLEDPEPITILHKRAIPTFLFYFIVERHLPRRVKVLTCMLKFIIVVFILAVSIELLIRFDQFQELSLVSHVFTVLFICALPKIFKVMCASHHYKARKKMRKRIQNTIETLIRLRSQDSSDSDTGRRRLVPLYGYGTFDIEERDSDTDAY